jgi:hypothetical protein
MRGETALNRARHLIHALVQSYLLILSLFQQNHLLVKAQINGENVVYLSAGQTLNGYVAGMTSTSQSPSKLLLGAWFKPTCSKRVSIVSKAYTQKEIYQGIYAPLWHGLTTTSDSEKRTIACGSWVAVAYLFDIKNNGRYWNELEYVYAIGPFEDTSNNVDIKLKYSSPTLSGQTYVLLEAPSGVTVHNPFYYLSYTSNRGTNPGDIGATLLEIEPTAVREPLQIFYLATSD